LHALRSSKLGKNAILKICLGAAVILGIVRKHRGAITVETELGQWSTSVFLPASGEEFLPTTTQYETKEEHLFSTSNDQFRHHKKCSGSDDQNAILSTCCLVLLER